MAEPQNVLDVLTLKRNDNRPTVEMSIADINEAAEQPSDDVAWDEYDRDEFDEATRIELHMDYYDEDADEFVRVVDGQEAEWDSSGDAVSIQLDREATDRAGEYYFEWVLVFDEAPPEDSADAEEVNTVPSTGFYNLSVNDPTDRQLETAGAEDRTVGTLTVEDDLSVAGTLQNDDGAAPRLPATVPTDAQQATHKQYVDNQVDSAATGDDIDSAVSTHTTEDVHNQPQPPETHDHSGGESGGDSISPSEVGTESDPVGSVRTDEADITRAEHDYAESVDHGRLKIDDRNLNQWSLVGQQFDNFEDLTHWTATSGELSADTLENNDDITPRGTQAAYLTQGSDTDIVIERDVDLDLTDKRFSLSVRTLTDGGDTTGRQQITVTCFDHNDNNIQFKSRYRANSPDADFRYLNLGVEGSTDVDLKNIKRVAISPADDADLNEWWIDSARLVPAPETGKLVLDFDGFSDGLFDWAEPILSEHGYTAYASSRLETYDEGREDTWDQLEWLRDERGWTIGAHGYFSGGGSMDERDPGEQREDMEISKGILKEKGFHVGADHRTFLQDAVDQSTLDIAQEYYLTGRNSDRIAHGVPTNPLIIPSVPSDGGLSAAQDELDNLAEFGGYGRIYFHPDDRLGEQDLRDVIEYVADLEAAGEIEVVGIKQLYSEWESYQAPHKETVTIGDTDGWEYAGRYDGTTPTERLESALESINIGDSNPPHPTIYLEPAIYSDDLTYDYGSGVRLVGSGSAGFRGTRITGNWTFEDNRINLEYVDIRTDLTFNGDFCEITRCGFTADILINGDHGYVGDSIGSDSAVIFDTGTSGGLVDGCRRVSVTDPDGNNTEGTIG